MDVIKITTVYGDTVHCRAADFDKARHMIRMTTADGTYLTEQVDPRTGLIVEWPKGKAHMLARENIAKVGDPRGAPSVSQVAMDLIDPDPTQPRQHFDAGELAELAASIKAKGLLQPITVRPVGDRYQIVMGERRWRAHQLLGADTIAAQVRDMTDRDKAIAAIVENLQRVDVTPLEEADAFARLVAQGMTPEEIAKETGAVLFRVQWRLRLLGLDPAIRKLFETGNLDRQQAMEIARLSDHADQHRILRLINRGHLSGWKAVRNAVDAILGNVTQADIFGDAGKASDEDVARLTAMEKRIQSVATMVGKGWKDGECVVATRVNPDRVSTMAGKIAEIQKALRIMERELRNASAQVAVVTAADL